MPQEQENGHKPHVINYTVDDEPQITTERELSARQILFNALIDTSNYYLVFIQGHHQTSYQNNPDDQIKMHENMKFISVFTGETPVS